MIIIVWETYNFVGYVPPPGGDDPYNPGYDEYDRFYTTFDTETLIISYLSQRFQITNGTQPSEPTQIRGVFWSACTGDFGYTRRDYSSDNYGQVTYVDTPNSKYCGYVGCDLLISSVTITRETKLGADDAKIVVNATSGAVNIQYSLDNVVFQASNTFERLRPGDYTVYVKDGNDCTSNQAITVLPAPYGLKYEVEYTDYLKETTFARIFQRNYEGEVFYKKGGSDPVSIRLTSEGDYKYKSIKGSECVLTLFADTNYEFLSIINGDEREFLMEVVKQESGEAERLIWRGYVLTDLHQEPYSRDNNYLVQITATDGLGVLSKQMYTTLDNLPTEGLATQLSIITACLKKLNLALSIYSAINVFEMGMNAGPDDDPIAQAYVDQEVYQNDAGTPFNCLDVLEANLKVYGAQIRQNNGAWHIVNVSEAAATYRRRKYSFRGEFVLSEDHNPVKTVTGPLNYTLSRILFVEGSQSLAVSPGHKEENAYQDYGLRANLIPDGEFYARAFASETALKKWTGTAVIKPSMKLSTAQGGTQPYAVNADGSTPGKIADAQKKAQGVVVLRSLGDKIPQTYSIFNADDEYAPGQLVTYNNHLWQKISFRETNPSEENEEDWNEVFPTVAGVSYAYGTATYIQSQPISLVLDPRLSFEITIDFSIERPLRASFYILAAFEVKLGAKWLSSTSEWVDTQFILYKRLTRVELGKSQNFSITTNRMVAGGDLVVKLYQVIAPQSSPYNNDLYNILYKSVTVKPLIDDSDPAEGLSVNSFISDNYSEVSDVVDLIHSDLPSDVLNARRIYKCGIYINRAAPYEMAFTGYSSITGSTVLVGTGTNPELDNFSAVPSDQVYVYEADNPTVALGPYNVLGFLSANNNLIISKPYAPPSKPGRVVTVKTFTSISPTKYWYRRGGDAEQRTLTRLLLQQIANNFARPTQQISGVLLGRLDFITAIYDPQNPNRWFLLNACTYSDHTRRFSGEFVELIRGPDTAVIETPDEDELPLPVAIRYRLLENYDTAAYENLGKKTYENGLGG